MTNRVRHYIRLVARMFIQGDADNKIDRRKNAMWDRMTGPERDLANRLVQLVFKEWL